MEQLALALSLPLELVGLFAIWKWSRSYRSLAWAMMGAAILLFLAIYFAFLGHNPVGNRLYALCDVPLFRPDVGMVDRRFEPGRLGNRRGLRSTRSGSTVQLGELTPLKDPIFLRQGTEHRERFRMRLIWSYSITLAGVLTLLAAAIAPGRLGEARVMASYLRFRGASYSSARLGIMLDGSS
jgi:hypothetical protein